MQQMYTSVCLGVCVYMCVHACVPTGTDRSELSHVLLAGLKRGLLLIGRGISPDLTHWLPERWLLTSWAPGGHQALPGPSLFVRAGPAAPDAHPTTTAER